MYMKMAKEQELERHLISMVCGDVSIQVWRRLTCT